MTPIHFGAPERRMFGTYHQGQPGSSRAVLLCNPLGQEAIRAHRFYRVLAERLARAGLHVLRFDPFGTGDSMGTDEDLTVSGWQRDVLSAHGELLRRAPGARVSWAGARLGASLALMAALQSPVALAALALWDPILDGAKYRSLLRLKHADALTISYGVIGEDWHAMLQQNDAFQDEAIGFALSESMNRELRDVDLRNALPPSEVTVKVLGDPADQVLSEWVRHCAANGARLDFTPLVHDFDWTAEEAVNTALVPPKALQYFFSTLSS